jgi:hypothetical protein
MLMWDDSSVWAIVIVMCTCAHACMQGGPGEGGGGGGGGKTVEILTPEVAGQAYINFGWGSNFRLGCNPNDAANPDRKAFSESGYRLARILWIHYVSKVQPLAWS